MFCYSVAHFMHFKYFTVGTRMFGSMNFVDKNCWNFLSETKVIISIEKRHNHENLMLNNWCVCQKKNAMLHLFQHLRLKSILKYILHCSWMEYIQIDWWYNSTKHKDSCRFMQTHAATARLTDESPRVKQKRENDFLCGFNTKKKP